MLAGWSVGVTARRPMAAASSEMRQADALRHADFVDVQGLHHHMGELTAPLVLVNLWAAWCPGCLIELPSLRALTQRLGPEVIEVVMLSHDMNWSGDVAFARRTAIPFRHWRLDPQAPDRVTEAAFRVEADRFGLPQSAVLAGRNRLLVDATLGTRDWPTPEQVRMARDWLAAAG
jgi:thiol-disulfide isomerase/thioredoxin